MYNGKHVKARRLRWKREFVLICSVIVLVLGAVGGSLAYLLTNTDLVVNTFTAPETGVDIHETVAKNSKTNVSFTNTSDYPVYMRARLIINWEDKNGNIVPSVPDDYTYAGPNYGVDWQENGGYYYYKGKVSANGGFTTNFLNSITSTVPTENPEYFLRVDVLVETVQAEPEQAVLDVWGFVPGASEGGN